MIKRIWNNYRKYKQTYRELQSLNDKELADIGISRYDIHSIAKEVSTKEKVLTK